MAAMFAVIFTSTAQAIYIALLLILSIVLSNLCVNWMRSESNGVHLMCFDLHSMQFVKYFKIRWHRWDEVKWNESLWRSANTSAEWITKSRRLCSDTWQSEQTETGETEMTSTSLGLLIESHAKPSHAQNEPNYLSVSPLIQRIYFKCKLCK